MFRFSTDIISSRVWIKPRGSRPFSIPWCYSSSRQSFSSLRSVQGNHVFDGVGKIITPPPQFPCCPGGGVAKETNESKTWGVYRNYFRGWLHSVCQSSVRGRVTQMTLVKKLAPRLKFFHTHISAPKKIQMFRKPLTATCKNRNIACYTVKVCSP